MGRGHPCRRAARATRVTAQAERFDAAGGLERVAGIEPAYSAWKAAALPLSYTRETEECRRSAGSKVVGEVGLEPTKA